MLAEQTTISHWMDSLLERYLTHLGLGKSTQTVSAYASDLKLFSAFVRELRIRSAMFLTRDLVERYLIAQRQLKSESTVARYYMSLRSFCRFLRRDKVIVEDFTDGILNPRNNEKAPHIPSEQDIGKLLAQPNVEEECGCRDRAILELLYSSGLRASELCDLELADVKDEAVFVSCGKRDGYRIVPTTEEARTWIEKYVREYRGYDEGLLFVTKVHKKQLRRQMLCKIVADTARRAGLKGITTHTLRHACATHLLEQGADIRFIQKVLGHASITSTQKYTHLSSESMQEMFKKFHPRDKNEKSI